MTRAAVLTTLLIGLLISGGPTHGKCPAILVRVQGEVVGQIQEGDELLLKFVYSPKRVETSSPHPVKDKTFTLEGAYSTYRKTSVLKGDICDATPRHIQLVMRDRNGVVLDTVDLVSPDDQTREIALNFGNKQRVVVHRTVGSHPLVLPAPKTSS